MVAQSTNFCKPQNPLYSPLGFELIKQSRGQVSRDCSNRKRPLNAKVMKESIHVSYCIQWSYPNPLGPGVVLSLKVLKEITFHDVSTLVLAKLLVTKVKLACLIIRKLYLYM